MLHFWSRTDIGTLINETTYRLGFESALLPERKKAILVVVVDVAVSVCSMGPGIMINPGTDIGRLGGPNFESRGDICARIRTFCCVVIFSNEISLLLHRFSGFGVSSGS